MKIIVLIFAVFLFISSGACRMTPEQGCFTGAFLADNPDKKAISDFKNKYGKKPYLVMVFLDWGKFPAPKIIEDIYGQGCVLFLTWEPWNGITKEAIDYDGLLFGKYDDYIAEFARKINAAGKTVFLRFAHEPNGSWYPWSGKKIGAEKFVMMYRHVKDIFSRNK